MPVISSFGRLRWVDHLKSRVQGQPGQQSKSLSPEKIKIKSGWAWGHVPVVPATREADVGGSPELAKVKAAVRHGCATAFQPGRRRETLSQRKDHPEQQRTNLSNQTRN